MFLVTRWSGWRQKKRLNATGIKTRSSYLGGAVSPEGPPIGEKQSDGVTEEAGKTVREIMRVYKCALEDGIKESLQKIP